MKARPRAGRDRYVRTKEAAKHISVSPSTLYKLWKAGVLHPRPMNGTGTRCDDGKTRSMGLLWDVLELDAYMESMKYSRPQTSEPGELGGSFLWWNLQITPSANAAMA